MNLYIKLKGLILAVLLWSVSGGLLAQCMSIDISINRACTDGQGVITILTGDPDSVTYSIDGGATFVNTPQFSNLNVGVYNVVVQDTTGCVVNLTAEIEQFLQVGPITVTPSCATPPSGVVDIRGNLGKPIYQYSFDGGQSFFTADSIKTELAAGTYNVVIKDSYGCEVDTTITVGSYPAISPTIVTTNEQCNGSGPGGVDVTLDGATYDFSLDGGTPVSATSYNNTNLLAGFYVLDITDVNGCTTPFQFQIGADLVDDSVQINHEYCHGENGEMEVFGFLGQTPYEYSIDNGATYQPSGVFSNLTQGEYVVFIKDATGCVKEDTIYVTNFGGVVATPSLDDTVCYGNDAIVSVSHNGGVTASYQWSNGLSDAQSHVVTPLTTTTYSVIVTDDFGCKDTAEMTITVETIPTVFLNTYQIHACIGEEIELVATGANDTYLWSTGDVGDTLSYIASGNETITVTGYNGQCSDSEQAVIVIKPSPTVQISSSTTSINTGDSIFFYSTGSVTSTVLWNFGDGFSSQEMNPYHRFDFAGAYMVTLTGEMGGCEASDSLLVYVGVASVNEYANRDVLVYPNPAKESFMIESTQEQAELVLYDMSGKQVLLELLRKGQNSISVETLESGFYLGAVVYNKERLIFRLAIE